DLVTGVQTCALPIYAGRRAFELRFDVDGGDDAAIEKTSLGVLELLPGEWLARVELDVAPHGALGERSETFEADRADDAFFRGVQIGRASCRGTEVGW